MARAAMVGWLLLAAGCGGSVEGSVRGHTLRVAAAGFVLQHLVAGQEPFVNVFLSDAPDVCERLETRMLVGGANELQLGFFRLGGDGSFVAVTPGDMPVVAVVPQREGVYGAAFFSNFDPSCQRTLPRNDSVGVDGLIRLESFDPETTAIGTFELVFGSGDEVKGSFEARRCRSPLTGTTSACDPLR